jgi:hypothetical protein
MKFGRLINSADTGETADASIASENAVAQGDDDDDNSKNAVAQGDDDEDSSKRNKRSIDFKTIDALREDGRIYEKFTNRSQGQELGNMVANDSTKKTFGLILCMAAVILVLIGVVYGTIEVVKNRDSTIPGDGEDDPFDFSDINEIDSLTASVYREPEVYRERTATPSISTFDFDFDFEHISSIPSSKSSTPPTHKPTKSYYPTQLPSKSPSLVPSTTPPTGSNATSELLSTPTLTPTRLVEPVARPPIIPFSDDDSDSILTFCVIADAPYTQKELDELPGQIATQMEGCEFLVHLGDIFIGDTLCDIKDYEAIHDIMLESHAPAFLVPGDNEWNDCVRSNIDIGWNHWTDHFIGFEDNWNHTFSIMRQPDYEENFYFIEKRTLVFGLNIVGGRVHDKTEWKTRLQSEYAWVRDVMLLNLVDMNTTDGVILMAHAHPSEDHKEFFNAFRVFLRDELKNEFPVLYLHGDGHDFMYTPNFHDQSNFLRIQHEGGTIEPVLKIKAGPGRGSDRRSSIYDAFEYDRQLEFIKTNQKKD